MAKAKKRPAEAWTYVLEADRTLDPSEQSRFLLSPMTYTERATVRDRMLSGDYTHRSGGEIALGHIVSIENFPAGNSQPWPTDREERRKYLELLDDDDVLEIGNEVWKRSALGLEEQAVKNFSPPERISSSGDTSTTLQSSTPVAAATPTPS